MLDFQSNIYITKMYGKHEHKKSYTTLFLFIFVTHTIIKNLKTDLLLVLLGCVFTAR
jgi:hypothetical protein